MEANELRIGDYVKFMLNDEDYEIISIDVKDLELIEKKQGVYEPIELTEEWLLKFGFECVFTNDDHHYYLESIDLSLDRSYQPFGIGEYKLKFEYVHQLQNLYFALTGKELTFKSE